MTCLDCNKYTETKVLHRNRAKIGSKFVKKTVYKVASSSIKPEQMLKVWTRKVNDMFRS